MRDQLGDRSPLESSHKPGGVPLLASKLSALAVTISEGCGPVEIIRGWGVGTPGKYLIVYYFRWGTTSPYPEGRGIVYRYLEPTRAS